MRFACCVPKATNTHSQYILLIDLSQQQWLHERASLLCHTFIACLVEIIISLRDLIDIGVYVSTELNTLIYIYIYIYIYIFVYLFVVL